MKYNAHNYQKQAEDFILTHPIAALFLQMGLGKSIITLTALEALLFDYFVISRVLVIAPLRVAANTWPSEITKWDHLSYLDYSLIVGTPAERKRALNKRADIYITNRENLVWLVENTALHFDTIVVDELSSFKNHKAKRFKALMLLRPKAKRVIALTGTPASNSLMDLWAEYRFLDYGVRLERFITNFRNKYFDAASSYGNIVYSYKIKEGAEEIIYKKIEDITLSMKALDHLTMPELINVSLEVKMSEEEKAVYQAFKKELCLTLDGVSLSAVNAASLTGKLVQLANGAAYTDDKKTVVFHVRKLDALEDLVETDESLLIAYWFKHDKERIEKRLKELKRDYIILDDEKSIKDWNSKKVKLALIHPASSGHGLNLQSGGNHLVWFSLPWSLELYLQTVARLYRQGQSENTVVVHHLVTKSTIDERIMKVLEHKEEVQDSLLRALVKEEIRQND